MEKLICRRRDGPGLRRVEARPRRPLGPVSAASLQERREAEPQLAPPVRPRPGSTPPAHGFPSSAAHCKTGDFTVSAAGKGAAGPGKSHSLPPQGPWEWGVQDVGGRGTSPRALTPQACRARWRASHAVLTEVHAVSVVALKQRQEQLSQRGRGLPGDAGGTGHHVDRTACPGGGGRGVCVWREGHSRGDQRLVLLIEEAEVLGAAGLEVRARGPGVSVPAALSH